MAQIPAGGEPLRPRASRRRLRLDDVTVESGADGLCQVTVRMDWQGRPVQGETRGVDTLHGRVRASADSTLAALLDVAREVADFELVGVKAFRAFDGWVVVVRVVGDAAGRKLNLLGASSSDAEEDLPRTAAQAVLDATNRVVEGFSRPS